MVATGGVVCWLGDCNESLIAIPLALVGQIPCEYVVYSVSLEESAQKTHFAKTLKRLLIPEVLLVEVLMPIRSDLNLFISCYRTKE